MGFRPAQQSNEQTEVADRSTAQSPATESTTQPTPNPSQMGRTWPTIERAEEHFGMQIPNESTLQRLERHEQTYGHETHEWIAEGMPVDAMGSPRDMEAFRQRQSERPPEVPTNIERQNKRSVLRSEKAAAETEPAGETGVPGPVREVISSRGRSLDGSIQRAIEDRMGDSFGDVRIHTGSTAAAACESINARAFTVGNHIAFNSGEYDPSSPEGQHVLAHELAHVRQQTEGTVSMLPQEDMELEVDPDPALEREAEETAQQVMQGGALGIQRMADTDVHIQRAGLGSHISQDRTWSPGGGPDQPQQPAQPDGQPVEINVDEIEADPEKLAQEVQEIKANQQLVMETLTEAQPGSPTDMNPAQTAIEGLAGSLAGAGTGALIGTLVGGPAGTAVGAGVGAVGSMVSDLTKQGVGYSADRLPGSKAQNLEEMYSEITRMYEKLKEGSEHAETVVGTSRSD